MERYNGWANRDTWLVVLWLDNEERNYRKILELDVRNLKHLTIPVIKRHLYFGDEINWTKVDLNEIHDHIRETLENVI